MTGNLVMDCSAIAGLFFEDERGPYHDRLLDLLTDNVAFVPAIWMSEMANVFIMGERRKRLNRTQVDDYMQDLMAFELEVISFDSPAGMATVLKLARQFNLTVYDAQYLQVAITAGLPLATMDKKLKDAAIKSGVAILN